jgi:GxxExxY protein
MTVSNALGAGFLEKVYENALAHELRKAGLAVVQQRGLVVIYDGVVVGEYAV